MSANSTSSIFLPPANAVNQPRETQQPALYACVITTCIGSAVFVALRFYTRAVLLGRRLISADWCALAAWMAAGGLAASSLDQVHRGLGLHIWDTDPRQFAAGVRAAWYGYVFYSTAMGLTKVSILLLYLTFLAVGRGARRAAVATLAFVVVANLWIAASNFTACVPLQAYWDFGLRARLEMQGQAVHCHSNTVWYVNGAINLVTDFVIFALPLPVVWSMRKLSWRQRFALLSLFGMGFFVCIIAIIRLVFLTGTKAGHDFTWNITGNTFWTAVEVNLSIAVASAMTLRPLMTRWFPCAFVSFDVPGHGQDNGGGNDHDNNNINNGHNNNNNNYAATAVINQHKHDSSTAGGNTQVKISSHDGNFTSDVALTPPTIGSRRTRTAHRDDHTRCESWIDFPGKLDGAVARDLQMEDGRVESGAVSTATTLTPSLASLTHDGRTVADQG